MFTKLNETKVPFRLLLVGGNHVGKTTTLGRVVKAGYNIYILDFDKFNVQGLKEVLTEEEHSRVFHIDLSDISLDKEGKKSFDLDQKETGFERSKEVISYLEKEKVFEDPSNIVFIDGLTQLGISALLTAEKSKDARLRYNAAWQGDNGFLNWFGTFLLKTKNVPIVIAGHTSRYETKDDSIPREHITFQSATNGSQFPNIAGITCLHFIERDKKTKKISICTDPTYKEFIKNSYNGIPDRIEPDWYLSTLIHYHRTGKWEYPYKKISI